MLEEGDGAPGIHQQGVVGHRVAALHAGVTSVANGQAVEDLRPPDRRRSGCRQNQHKIDFTQRRSALVTLLHHSGQAGEDLHFV